MLRLRLFTNFVTLFRQSETRCIEFINANSERERWVLRGSRSPSRAQATRSGDRVPAGAAANRPSRANGDLLDPGHGPHLNHT